MNTKRFATLFLIGALGAFCAIALLHATLPPFVGFIAIPAGVLLILALAAVILEPATAEPRLTDGNTRVLPLKEHTARNFDLAA